MENQIMKNEIMNNEIMNNEIMQNENKKNNKKDENKKNKKTVNKKTVNKKTENRKAEDWIAQGQQNTAKEKERKQMLCAAVKDKNYRPMRLKELAAFLVVPREERETLKLLLDELIHEGKLSMDGRGRYRAGDANLRIGLFHGTARGFGFVAAEGEQEDIYIPETETKGALDGDTVKIAICGEPTGKRREGKVLEITKRGSDELVGTFQSGKGFGFVVPDNRRFPCDIFIPKEKTLGAVNGHKVVVKLTEFGGGGKSPEGEIIRILGHINDPGVDVLSVIYAYGIPVQYPEEVLAQAEAVPEELNLEECGGRLNLTALQTVTIDGEDAKDLDDAVTLSRENGLWHLGVHIADVSEYVTEGSLLDEEALRRGTSVYLVDRVVPMLPHRLSNGICSLNAGSSRLALSCLMDIDEKGNVVGHRLAETVIRVDRRMTYTSVRKIIEEHDEEECAEYEELVPMLEQMDELAGILREKRRKRGSIDFDFPECKIVVDEEGRPEKILPYERNRATRLIEDFMLIANETVAEDSFWQELPFLYRTHENPDAEKLQRLGIFINNFGYRLHIGQEEFHPKELQKLLAKVEGTPEEALVARLCLRSMKQARYTDFCDGHFGLAARYYCHFTSPIRRYPDLQIHRIIKENLRGKLGEGRIAHYRALLPDIASQTSRLERRADEAEREVEKLKKVEYMSERIGEIFDGVVSGVTSWGMYVELPDTVEGMIRMAELQDDFYIFDEEHWQLVGEHTRRTFKLGQRVRVEIAGTDKIMRTIDMRLADTDGEQDSDRDGKY